MKLILKKTKLEFQIQKDFVELLLSNGSGSAVTGNYTLDEDQSNPTEASRFITGNNDFLPISEHFIKLYSDHVGIKRFMVLFYDAEKNYIAKNGSEVLTSETFVSGNAIDILEDISDYCLPTSASSATAVSRETVKANAKFWKIVVIQPIPYDTDDMSAEIA